jgi:hypothetical protein
MLLGGLKKKNCFFSRFDSLVCTSFFFCQIGSGGFVMLYLIFRLLIFFDLSPLTCIKVNSFSCNLLIIATNGTGGKVMVGFTYGGLVVVG